MEYKVPFRQVYTLTFKDWIKETIWCHFIIRIWKHLIDLESDNLKATYVDNPQGFYEQYEWRIREVNNLPHVTFTE